MKTKKSSIPKRYIVTFRNPQTDFSTAASILSAVNVLDGVSVMATDAQVGETDALHFEGVGATSVVLSNEQAQELDQHEEVLAVEEDIQMFALYERDKMFETEFSSGTLEDMAARYFGMGYSQGVLDTKVLFAKALKPLLDRENGYDMANASRPLLGAPAVGTKQLVPWNVAMVKAPEAWGRGVNGKDVKVAVLDTGIADHEDLAIAGGICFVPGIASYQDDHGHGTHCAGIIGARNSGKGVTGVAPGASLYAVKVLSRLGAGDLSWIIAGMEWSLKNNMNIISMSLGAPSKPLIAYTTIISRLVQAGVNVVCASGNHFSSSFPWVVTPANSHLDAIAVGAIDSSRNITSFSSRGINGTVTQWNGVSLVAPGVLIRSTWPGNTHREKTGTSMACPHVSGAVALVCQKFPNLNPRQIKAKIISSATDLGAPDFDLAYGAGLLDCDLLTL